MTRQDQPAAFAWFVTIWISASLIGWMTDLQILSAGVGIVLGWIFARHFEYSDQAYLDDMNSGLPHVPSERRQLQAALIGIFGIAFSAALILVPVVVELDDLRFATPALGGILVPSAFKFYFQTRRINAEGISQ